VLWGLLHAGLGASMVVNDLADGLPTGETAAESLLYFIAGPVIWLAATVCAFVARDRAAGVTARPRA